MIFDYAVLSHWRNSKVRNASMHNEILKVVFKRLFLTHLFPGDNLTITMYQLWFQLFCKLAHLSMGWKTETWHLLNLNLALPHLKSLSFTLFALLWSTFYQDGDTSTVMSEMKARAPIGRRLSPLRPPHWGFDKLWVWWMRESVCVFVCVCKCQEGHHSVEGPHGLALQSNEAFQKGGGKTPSTSDVTHTHTHTHNVKKRTLCDDHISQEKEWKSHLLRNVSDLDTNIVIPLREKI